MSYHIYIKKLNINKNLYYAFHGKNGSKGNIKERI